ncbi:MAG: phosphatase PAP2 family protein [Ferruginibacter sp.]
MLLIKRLGFICFISGFLFYPPVSQSQNVDISLLKSINPQNPKSVFFKTTTNSYMIVAGTVSLGSLAYALIEKNKGLQYKSYELIMGVGINIVATAGMKAIFNRPRPAETYPNEIFILTVSNGHSFPSGHTSVAFATATSLALTHGKWYVIVPAYLWAGCVGYSRMYLGMHYPSDVLGGALVGAGSSFLSHWLSKKLFEKKSAGTPPSNAF